MGDRQIPETTSEEVAGDGGEAEWLFHARRRIHLRTLYRYFRTGGVYQYEPQPPHLAALAALLYWRKGVRA